MNKIEQRTMLCCVVIFFLFFGVSLISTVHAENKVNENEVVIHSNNVNIVSPGASQGVQSPGTLPGATPETSVEMKKVTPADGNEVVIHSNHVNIVSPGASQGVQSPGALPGTTPEIAGSTKKDDFYEDVTTYDELVEYLKKEKDYLGKLGQKFDGLRQNVSTDLVQGNVTDTGVRNSRSDVVKLSTVDGTLAADDSSVESQTAENEKEGELESDKSNKRYVNPFDKAEVLYEGGKYHGAWKAYKMVKVEGINERDYIWSQFQICNCYRAVKKFDEAAKMYQEFINKYPDSFWAEQAAWYIQDSKWWKEWNDKVEAKVVTASTDR